MENDTNTTKKDTSTEVSGMDANQIFKKKQLEGEQVEINELFNKPLLLRATTFINHNKGRFAVMQLIDTENDHLYTLTNGSKIVLEKLDMLIEASKNTPDDLGHILFNPPYKVKIVGRISSTKQEYHDLEGWE